MIHIVADCVPNVPKPKQPPLQYDVLCEFERVNIADMYLCAVFVRAIVVDRGNIHRSYYTTEKYSDMAHSGGDGTVKGGTWSVRPIISGANGIDRQQHLLFGSQSNGGWPIWDGSFYIRDFVFVARFSIEDPVGGGDVINKIIVQMCLVWLVNLKYSLCFV